MVVVFPYRDRGWLTPCFIVVRFILLIYLATKLRQLVVHFNAESLYVSSQARFPSYQSLPIAFVRLPQQGNRQQRHCYRTHYKGHCCAHPRR